MKKLTIILTAFFAFLVGCSPEKEAQIHEYWADQVKQFSQRLGFDLQQVLDQQRIRRGGSRLLTPEQQEEIMRALQQDQPDGNGKGNKTAAKPSKPLDAMLFLSPTCPWCQRLKKENFTRKFQDKYEGQIVLKEYMLDKQENTDLYSQMVKKYKLSGGVPLLIIGGTPIQGYSEKMLEQASAVADKEIKKNNLQNVESAALNTPPVLQVSMEDEVIRGPASAEDKKKMKRLLLSLQESNGETIQSIGVTFGAVVKNQAMAQVAQTEKKLKAVADQSADFASFKTQYDQILAQHNQAISALMLKNKDKIRNVR